METDLDIILLLFEFVWIPIIVALGWTIRRLLRHEKWGESEDSAFKTELAVLKANTESCAADIKRIDDRNEEDHKRMSDKMDSHNHNVMTRLDSLLRIARNGNK